MRITIDVLTFVKNGNQVNILHKEHGLHGFIILNPYAYFRDVKYKDGKEENSAIDLFMKFEQISNGKDIDAKMGITAKLDYEIRKFDKDGKETVTNKSVTKDF